ncbi:MAG: tetratricopeptide repeat protein [Desulfobacterales bacterium]|nr:tetratricopeptide repeat protein [Desulfobacterales bacterium]MDJ0883477.1 tetratricopeptide repeat protein [Desulfobacterales bacterium]
MKTRRIAKLTASFIAPGLLTLVLVCSSAAAETQNWFEQGLVELKNGHYQRAVEAFTFAIEAVPHDFEALNNRGFARIYTGDYDGAIADCTMAITLNPGSAKAYNNRGFAYIFKGSYGKALKDFDRAIAINPRYVDAYSNRCLARIRQERYPQAVTDCSQALAINPRSAKSLYNRGFARDRQGDPAGALGDYVQALSVNPDYIEVLNNIAWILATSPDERLRDGKRAVALAERANAHATDINFMDTLAAAYAEAGRYDDAVAMANRVISMLAESGAASELGPHVERLSLYEEGRPYRDPVRIRSVSAVTDLSRQFETLDRLMQPDGVQTADYQPMATNAAAVPALETSSPAAGAAPPVRMAQATTPPGPGELRVLDQTIFTPRDTPVEITLSAESDDRLPVTFDIESVPFQGALRGRLPHLIYTPRPGFTGTDRFTFRAGNAKGESRLATVIINVGQKTDVAADPSTPTDPEPPSDGDAGTAAKPDGTPAPESPPAAGEDQMPTPAVSLPADPVPGTAAMKPAEEPAPAEDDAIVPSADTAPQTPMPEPGPVPDLPTDLPPGSIYSIQVRSVKGAENAAREVAKLRREGLRAYSHAVDIPDKGTWHRIFVNGYPTKAAARQGLADLDATRFKDAYIRRIPAKMQEPAAPPPPPETPPAAPDADPVPAAAAPVEKPQETYPYSFQIKSYREKNDAFQLGVELTSLGRKTLIGVSRLGTTGDWYRVYIGCFRTPEEGEKIRDDLAAEGFEDAFLTIIPYTIAIQPPEHDPRGETLENQLLAKGYLPYRLPESDSGTHHKVLVGGFQSEAEAGTTLESLTRLGYEARVVLR